MKKLIILALISLSAEAQENLEKALEQNIQNEAAYRSVTAREEKNLKEAEEKLLQKKEEFMELQEAYNNRGENRDKILEAINAEIKSFNFFQKIGGKANYYKCLRESLESRGFINKNQCDREHSSKLKAEDLKKVEGWNSLMGKSPEEMKRTLDQLPQEIDRLEKMLPTYKANLRSAEMREESVKSTTLVLRRKIKEKNLLPQYAHFVNCDEKTPVINLEEKVPYPGAPFEGPFASVPRDNQDGLGTCFANTTKNLLVGLSGGKDVASFTDIALQYKKNNGSLGSSGLDGGISCGALNEIAKSGFCPQVYSPLENGERNLIGESLFNLDPYSYLAYNVNLLRDFVAGIETFKKSQSNDLLLSKAKVIIDKVKSNPDLIIPLPVARFNIPDEWKIREAYALHKSKLGGLSESQFLNEYQTQYQKFYPQYVKALLEGKNLDQIFELYKTGMNPFIQKYDLTSSLPEYKRVFLIDAKKDFNDPRFKTKLRESLNFLKEILGLAGESDAEVIEYCSTSGLSELKLLSSFRPLLEELKKNKINASLLFDDSGVLKSGDELMQLAVAPACLNPEKRQKLDFNYSCSDGYDTVSAIKNSGRPLPEKLKSLREKVVMSLVQGYPLGNSFPTGDREAHINTIVGLRFNQATKQCEYRIRESQTGRSEWFGETGLFNKMQALTEVRRE